MCYVFYEYYKIRERFVAYITDFGLCGPVIGPFIGGSEAYSPPNDDKLTEKFDYFA